MFFSMFAGHVPAITLKDLTILHNNLPPYNGHHSLTGIFEALKGCVVGFTVEFISPYGSGGLQINNGKVGIHTLPYMALGPQTKDPCRSLGKHPPNGLKTHPPHGHQGEEESEHNL